MIFAYRGPTYTWSSGRMARSPLFQRLDKAMANDIWQYRFPNAYLRHLPRYLSDHAPILLFFNPSPRGNLNCTTHSNHFRFENCRFTDPTLQHTIKQVWRVFNPPDSSQNNPLSNKLQHVSNSLQLWKQKFAPTQIQNNI